MVFGVGDQVGCRLQDVAFVWDFNPALGYAPRVAYIYIYIYVYIYVYIEGETDRVGVGVREWETRQRWCKCKHIQMLHTLRRGTTAAGKHHGLPFAIGPGW